MPSVNFTSKGITAIKPPTEGRVDYFDYGKLDDGCALGLRVSASGTKTWFAAYRFKGKFKRLTVGRYPDKSLKDATDEARTEIAKLIGDIDPATEKRQYREAPTFEQVAELFLLRGTSHLRDHGKRYREQMEKDFIPAWRDWKAQDITHADVVDVIDRIKDRGAVSAHRAHSMIRRFFNWDIQRGHREYNPATQIKRYEERSRDRVLTHDEIKTLWEGLPEADMAEQIRLVLKLMLVTGQRKGEILPARKSEFDMDKGLWSIPKDVCDPPPRSVHRVEFAMVRPGGYAGSRGLSCGRRRRLGTQSRCRLPLQSGSRCQFSADSL